MMRVRHMAYYATLKKKEKNQKHNDKFKIKEKIELQYMYPHWII